jgi:DNA-binding Xre family transcriptional regulator
MCDNYRKRGVRMSISYNKLWKILIDKRMKKKDLMNAAEFSTSTLAKLGKNQQVSMDVILRICKTLECNVGDVMDIVPEEDNETED